ncbi:MAG: S-methyl-5'-thioadenosine phosphorylase [Candidatus Micrarchaeota archaeon]|nr:S-methyl-5'-thioadenosine phosphorylase [Candidatus Micrarchaeota archaeon]
MEAEIGIIGGTGFYSLLENATEINVDTKYGKPSSKVSIGKIGGRSVAFIARHGTNHSIPPHKVPYRANIEAFANLGVKRIITSNAAGSLKKEYKPGDLVFTDQFVNMTHGRDDTFFDGGEVIHAAMADPYCSELRSLGISEAKNANLNFQERGTVVVVNGPRFSTRSESRFFAQQGFDIINMTQYPEVALAREKKICYMGIGIVTDYDVGLEGNEETKPVTFDEVQKVFSHNVEKIKSLINSVVPKISAQRNCGCQNI